MRKLKVKDIKKFVQGHPVDLEPEFWSLGPQNQIYYMFPLRDLYSHNHNWCKNKPMPSFETRDPLTKQSLCLKLSFHVVAICTVFNTEGTGSEGEVKMHPVHTVLARRGEQNEAWTLQSNPCLMEHQPLYGVLALTCGLEPDTRTAPEIDTILKCYV